MTEQDQKKNYLEMSVTERVDAWIAATYEQTATQTDGLVSADTLIVDQVKRGRKLESIPHITMEDIRVLRAMAQGNGQEIVNSVDRLVQGYQKRLNNQVQNQNRMMKKFGAIQKIVYGGGTSNTKVIELKKIV